MHITAHNRVPLTPPTVCIAVQKLADIQVPKIKTGNNEYITLAEKQINQSADDK